MPKWQWVLRHFRSKLWLRATLFCLAGIFTALIGFFVKDYIPEDISRKVGADAVGTILNIIASSMLAVTIFSLNTMVSAYAAASSSTTPRATRLLLEDSTAQNALSVFIGSFLYSLVGIIALNMGIYGNSGRLVLFVVTLGVIVIITAMLLQWIGHLSRLGRVGQTIDMVERATAEAIKQRLKRPYLGGTLLEKYKKSPSHYAITHPQIGYVQHIDMQKLADLAEKHEIDIFIQALPGAFNDSSAPVAYSSAKLLDEKCAIIRHAFSIDGDRDFDQDPRYGLIVLSEIASRALSPAVNDPGTAIDVIGTAVRVLAPWITCEACEPEILFPRIYVPALQLSELFDDMFSPIARDGAGMLEVIIRLQKAYASLAAIGDKECKNQAKRHWELTSKRAQVALSLAEEKEALEALAF